MAGKFTPGRQRALIVEVMKAIGFPFDRGRLDESDHPFTEGVAGDIRVTTRLDHADPFNGPAGRAARDRPCAATTSACRANGARSRWARIAAWRSRRAQSLLIEMIICRSRAVPRLAASAAGEALRRHRPGVGAGQPVPPADPRAAQRRSASMPTSSPIRCT